jgi:hypothetical protein
VEAGSRRGLALPPILAEVKTKPVSSKDILLLPTTPDFQNSPGKIFVFPLAIVGLNNGFGRLEAFRSRAKCSSRQVSTVFSKRL